MMTDAARMTMVLMLVLTVLNATSRIITKKLFEVPEQTEFTLMEDQIHDIPRVSDEENEILIADFAENEVSEAAFQMEHNKAPGSDDFPAEFCQVFWVIKDDLLAMFHDFHKDSLDLFSLNFGVITLIPKIENATKIQQY
jgi:hypothetical protein